MAWLAAPSLSRTPVPFSRNKAAHMFLVHQVWGPGQARACHLASSSASSPSWERAR